MKQTTQAYRHKKMTGVSLIEMVIVILIIGIMAGVVGPLLLNATRSANLASDLSTLNTQGQYTMSRISEDIRNTASIQSAAANSLSLTTLAGDSIAYSLDNNNYLIRNIDGTAGKLSANASALNFSYYDANGAVTSTIENVRYIRVQYTLTEAEQTETFRTTFYLRNV